MSLDQSADELLKATIELSLVNPYSEQLYTFSTANGPKKEVAVVYYVLLPSHKIDKEARKNWTWVAGLEQNLADEEIIEYAVKRLQGKVEYTNIIFGLLPQTFTLSELQSTYEIVLGRSLDKRNFRKKILSLQILYATGEKRKQEKARPAELYTFRSHKLTFVQIL